MKKIGFLGLAVATTLIGDVTLLWSAGLETVSGKSSDPLGSGGVHVDVGGSHAGGAGSELVVGDQVIGTGGVEGYDGGEGGGGSWVILVEFDPHAANAKLNERTNRDFQTNQGRAPEKTRRMEPTST